MATPDELDAPIAEQYARDDRAEQGRVLDEFVAVTGFTANTRPSFLRPAEQGGATVRIRSAVSIATRSAKR